MWSDKFRPRLISDMVGNEKARASVLKWATTWHPGIKPLLLVGPPGIGKTTISQLLAQEFDYDIIGMNASDIRNKAGIRELLDPVMDGNTIMGTPLIFIDEVDGIHGRSNFGGVEELIKILKEPTVRIILAANFNDSDKMKNLNKVVQTITFKPIPPRLLQVYLSHVLKSEGVSLGPGTTIRTITKSRGDIRSLLNIAQTFKTGFSPDMTKSSDSLGIEQGVELFFKAKTLSDARDILLLIKTDPRTKISAFYSSVIMTSSLSSEQLKIILGALSEADVLYGRIMRHQEWRLLRYLDNILLKMYIPNLSISYSKYNLSWSLLSKLRWRAASVRKLFAYLAPKFHVSTSVFATLYMPYIMYNIKNEIIQLDLDEEYAEIINKELEG